MGILRFLGRWNGGGRFLRFLLRLLLQFRVGVASRSGDLLIQELGLLRQVVEQCQRVHVLQLLVQILLRFLLDLYLVHVVLVGFVQPQWAYADPWASRVREHIFDGLFGARTRLGSLDLIANLSNVIIIMVHPIMVQLIQHRRQSLPLVLLLLRSEQVVIRSRRQVVVVLNARRGCGWLLLLLLLLKCRQLLLLVPLVKQLERLEVVKRAAATSTTAAGCSVVMVMVRRVVRVRMLTTRLDVAHWVIATIRHRH